MVFMFASVYNCVTTWYDGTTKEQGTTGREKIMFDHTAAPILGTGTPISPAKPAGHWCYETTDALYVIRKDNGKVITVRSCGLMSTTWAIGTRHSFQGDQTGRSLGEGVVIGINDAGKVTGEVPTRKTPYYVFK